MSRSTPVSIACLRNPISIAISSPTSIPPLLSVTLQAGLAARETPSAGPGSASPCTPQRGRLRASGAGATRLRPWTPRRRPAGSFRASYSEHFFTVRTYHCKSCSYDCSERFSLPRDSAAPRTPRRAGVAEWTGVAGGPPRTARRGSRARAQRPGRADAARAVSARAPQRPARWGVRSCLPAAEAETCAASRLDVGDGEADRSNRLFA